MADYYHDLFLTPAGSVDWHRFGLPQMHVRAFNATTWLWRDQDSDVVWVSTANGASTLGGRTQGNYPAAFDELGVVWVQHDASGVLTGYHLDGTPTGTTLAAPYAAEGIADVQAGRVVMMNDPSRIRLMPNGETWLNCVETPNFIVGQFGHDASGYGGSISSCHKPTGQVRRWLGYTPLPVFAREDAQGHLYVAISGNEAPAPDQVVWATSFPVSQPAPAPVPEPQPVRPVSPERPEPAPVSVHAACRAEIAKLKARLSATTQDLATAEAASQALATELERATEQQRKQSEAIKQMPSYLRSVVEFYLKPPA